MYLLHINYYINNVFTMNITFQIYHLVSKIPKGKITTYKILAEKLGIKSPQLVGKILYNNQEPVTIPCHRVVRSNRKIGGYKLGIKKKVELLCGEGIKIRDNKIVNFENILERF